MTFRSILFDEADPAGAIDALAEPDCFHDLHLDEIVAAITAGRDAYRLTPFFYAPLKSVHAIAYRQQVFRDLERPAIRDAIGEFARRMGTMRAEQARADRAVHRHERERWILAARETYCTTIDELERDLAEAGPRSPGLVDFEAHLAAYVASPGFATLRTDTRRVAEDLAGVRYRLHIAGTRIRVSGVQPEPDYGAEVLETFARFRQGASRTFQFAVEESPDMSGVEVEVVQRVARLHPEVFAALHQFCAAHRQHLDPTIVRFDREVQLYIAVIAHVERLTAAGLPFCFPRVTDGPPEIEARGIFDLALASRLAPDCESIVTNDVLLRDPERILVVTGPNQGGKTTFARTIGQLHYLAALGCPVPGTNALLGLVDVIFTHFEREEDLRNFAGKLEEELLRIREILVRATSGSLLVMNESFASTSLDDALLLSREVMAAIIERDLACVFVTFLDELASLGPTVVSLVSAVDAEDPSLRTFRIVRRPADGLAYAVAIAEKHRLTHGDVKARLGR